MPESLSLKDTQNSYYAFISGLNPKTISESDPQAAEKLSDYDAFDNLDDADYPSILVPKRKGKKNKGKYRPLSSLSTLNAYLGLNQSHIPLVIFTIEGWHNDVLHNGYEGVDNVGYFENLGLSIGATILSPWAAIPITLYVLLTLLNARAVVQKNIVYNENRIRYLQVLQTLKTNITFDNTAITLEKFNEDHQALLDFNTTQLRIDPPKKFFRAVLVFGILFISILPLSWSVILLTAICSLIVTRMDYMALNSEINKDLAIKKLQWELIQTQEIYIEELLKKIININFNPVNIGDPNDAQFFNKDKFKELDNQFVYTDHFFTVLGMNSGYMAFSLIVLFGVHELLMGATFVGANFVLFGLPAILCVAIGTYHAMENHKLYKFYEKEIRSLQIKNAQLKKDLHYLESLGYTAQLALLGDQENWIKNISNESKTINKYFEAIKKVVRPWQFFGLFGLLSFILAASLATGAIVAIIAVIAVASMIMGYADYKTRQYKETLEGEINTLKEEQINLLHKKSTMLKQYSPPTAPLRITTPLTEPSNRTPEPTPPPTPHNSNSTEKKSSASWIGYASAGVVIGAGIAIGAGAAAYYRPKDTVSQILRIGAIFK